jgi:hypothetical protein
MGSEPSPVGVYALLKLGDQELPAITSIGPGQSITRLVEGSLTILAGGTCSDRYTFEAGAPDEEPTVDVVQQQCTWTRTRNTVILRRPTGAVETALIQGTSLILGTGSQTLTFQR